jgi:hypothetical protein
MARMLSKPSLYHLPILDEIARQSLTLRRVQRLRDNAMAEAFARGCPVIQVARAAGISAQAARSWRDRRLRSVSS